MKWDLSKFNAKDVIFIGGGKGRSEHGVKSFLTKHVKLASFSSIEKTDDNLSNLALRYNLDETIFIKNEAIPGREVNVPYITPMQLFFELIHNTSITTIGITGSKGKSTTTALVAHILSEADKEVYLAGNIGVSPFVFLDEAGDKSIFVLEISSYQLSDMTISPHISACLNLYNDHTDWHGSLENYWEAKHNIVRYAHKEDIFVYNPNFPALVLWAKQASCKTIAIDVNEKLSLNHALLFGQHNKLNAIVARQIARQLGVSDSISNQAIASFKPLQHRMELIKVISDVYYIDDAIGMTPEATFASIKAIRSKYGPIGCLLIGGQDRNYDFSQLINEIVEQKIGNLVLFPDTVDKLLSLLPKTYKPNILVSTSMDEAVFFAYLHTPPHHVVLLSTAAPSYSLWTDFEQKGNQFVAAVNRLKEAS